MCQHSKESNLNQWSIKSSLCKERAKIGVIVIDIYTRRGWHVQALTYDISHFFLDVTHRT